MSKTTAAAVIVLCGGLSVAGLAHADALYMSADVFQPMTGANEAVIVRSSISTGVANTGASNVVMVAPAVRSVPVPAGADQSVTIDGTGNGGSCTVKSVAPSGFPTASFVQSQTAGVWHLTFTFTAAQAPAGNVFRVYCDLGPSSSSKLFGLSVSP